MNRRDLLLGIPAGMMFVMTAGAQTTTITGAGATFPAPLYHKWAQEAQKAIGVQVNYQSIGSGAGINQIRARTVVFGATDAPLQDPGDLYQFPTVEGRVVPIFNLPGITDLNLTMREIINIYLGNITMWNDPAIVALNPGKSIPRLPIVPVYRADGSGTTFIWTKGMKEEPGSQWTDVGTSVRWPTGQGARGNEGVAATVQRTRGAIGYVEYAYSKINNIPIINQYVAGKTYILLPREPKDKNAHNEAIRFFTWCLKEGRGTAETMHYHTLTMEETNKIINDLSSMRA